MMAVFLLLISSQPTEAKTSSNTMKSPDFAFPQNVEKESRALLDKALRDDRPKEVLRQFINLTIASTSISNENIVPLLKELDSVNLLLKAPYNALGYLLEARIYRDIYLSDRFTFDLRTVPSDMANSNPLFWDSSLFASRIDSLVALALSEKKEAESMKLSDLEPLINCDFPASSFTVYDFIVYQSIELARSVYRNQTIPFFGDSNSGLNSLALIDGLLALHSRPSDARTAAILAKVEALPFSDRESFLYEEIAGAGKSETAVPLILKYYDLFITKDTGTEEMPEDMVSSGNQEKQPRFNYESFFRFVKDYARALGGNQKLKDLLAAMTNENIKLQYPDLASTGSPVTVKVSADNLREFYVLLLDFRGKVDSGLTLTEMISSMRRIDYRKVSFDGSLPFHSADSLVFEIGRPGTYCFIASRSPELKDIYMQGKKYYPSYLNVSDIDLIQYMPSVFTKQIEDGGAKDGAGCFVVNSADGSPVEGATVIFEKSRGYWGENTGSGKENVNTGSMGLARTSFDNATASVEYLGSKANSYVSVNRMGSNDEALMCRLFTDRAVYRPGDKVNFMGIVLRGDYQEAEIATDVPISIRLKNANYEVTDTISLTSDRSGRIFGAFTLPEDGLLGTWRLETGIRSQTFQVTEYKTPSLLVTLEKISADCDSIVFKGIAATYSGMPVGESKVEFTVNYSPLSYYYRENHREESFSSSVMTGPDGNFEIRLPLNHISPKDYRGVFSIRASVTDAAGETAQSPAVHFWLEPSYGIVSSLPAQKCIDSDSLSFQVGVVDMAGLPAVKTVSYNVFDSNEECVLSGQFESPGFSIDCSGLASGRYKFRFTIVGEDTPPLTADIILYRTSDEQPPVETCLWIPRDNILSTGGTIGVEYGCSYPGQHLLCIITDSKGDREMRWIESDGKNGVLEIHAPDYNERKYVLLCGYRNHQFFSQTITVTPEIQTISLKIETETFRNLLEPSRHEEWKFRLKFGEEAVAGYAYALLYDKALEAISPLRWDTRLFSPYYPHFVSINGNSAGKAYENFRISYNYAPRARSYRMDYQTYGFTLYDMPHVFIHDAMAPKMRMANDMTTAVEGDLAFEESFEEGMIEISEVSCSRAGGIEEEIARVAGPDDVGESAYVAIRDIEMPVAFFMPDLTSDGEGNVEIAFTVPNFNTTWNFIMGAYTSDAEQTINSLRFPGGVESASLRLEAVASKKVMVKMLPPRFLRTGDRAIITATLFNNTDEEREIWGSFEIFNPETGETLLRKDSGKSAVRASGSMVVYIEYDCPSSLNAIGLRAYAKSEGASDGEQTVIPVLPSSQPVVESDPFYISPGQEEFEMPLPAFPEGARVTFKYCDNPIWEAITALPAIVVPDSESLTAQISAFYANSVGYGIFRKHESLKKGLEMILGGQAGDSMLISHLEKDSELKTVALNNTPWVNDARSETLRLARLGSLLDEKEAVESVKAIWKRIMALRNPDGGWSWCKGMKSSQWMTEAFLINVGLLKAGGYLLDLERAEEAVNQSIDYVDGEYVHQYHDIKGPKDGFYGSLLPYLYTRSFFPEADSSFSMRKISKEALDYIDGHWESLSIFYKATAAVTLWRDGRRMAAREILESLRQFSSSRPGRGVWFDNLDSGWMGAGKLLTTARVLTAFNEIQPGDSIIDGLRQWLLLQKQGQDWQEGLWSIDVIDALLNSGSDWAPDYEAPVIQIAGHRIPVSSIAQLTGDVTADIDLSQTGRKALIKVRRNSPSPAWGGVVSQYIAPMKEVKADAIPDLSVHKEFWRLEDSPEGLKAVKTDSLKIGDRVRVSLIIDCGRDMDFVALTDERPACVEPADQLSGYTANDGLWYYRETRNNSTNIFFDFLPRGRHILDYECRVMEAGSFASGIAILQCLYSPLLTAHSAGAILVVE